MGIDLSENGRGYYDLKEHIGHKIVIVGYGAAYDQPEHPVNIAIECEDCGEVLVDFNHPDCDILPQDFIEPEERGEREVPECCLGCKNKVGDCDSLPCPHAEIVTEFYLQKIRNMINDGWRN